MFIHADELLTFQSSFTVMLLAATNCNQCDCVKADAFRLSPLSVRTCAHILNTYVDFLLSYSRRKHGYKTTQERHIGCYSVRSTETDAQLNKVTF